MNSDSVRVISAAANQTITNIAVQGLPGSIASTPDGGGAPEHHVADLARLGPGLG